MRNKSKKYKLYFLQVLFSVFVFVLPIYFNVKAVCVNEIPTPTDPNCDKPELSFGALVNRIIQVLPIFITLLAVAAIIFGGVKVLTAGSNDDKKQEGFKAVINAAIGAALFYSVWLILYLIEQATGVALINFR